MPKTKTIRRTKGGLIVHRLTVDIDAELFDATKAKAQKERLVLNRIVEHAFREFLNKKEESEE